MNIMVEGGKGKIPSESPNPKSPPQTPTYKEGPQALISSPNSTLQETFLFFLPSPLYKLSPPLPIFLLPLSRCFGCEFAHFPSHCFLPFFFPLPQNTRPKPKSHLPWGLKEMCLFLLLLPPALGC